MMAIRLVEMRITWHVIGECRSNRNSLSRTFDPTVSNIPTSPLPLRRSQRLGRVDESRATTSTHPALCSRPGETKGPLEAVSIHYRSTSLPRFVSVAWQARRPNRHKGCSHESRDNGQWSSNVTEDGLYRHAAGGEAEKES